MTSTPALSIVIPAWNEEDRLARTLSRYLPSLDSRGVDFEVIVVADGAGDRTADMAEGLADPRVRVLRFPSKLGKGGAILAGLRAVRGELVGYLDADGPIPPDQVYRMMDLLRDVDCVVASRWIRGSSGADTEPRFNRLAGRAWNLLVRSLLLLPIRDTQCGAKFFRRAVIGKILGTVTLTNRAFDVDLLYHIRKSGATWKEVPVNWRHDPASRMPIAHAIPIMFLSLVGIRTMNTPVGRRIPEKLVRWFHTQWGAE